MAEANVMSDGMLKEVNFGDLSLMSVLKDRPVRPIILHNENLDNTKQQK